MLLSRCLVAAGIERISATVYGPRFDVVAAMEIDDPRAVRLMAAADGCLGGGVGVAMVGEEELWFTAAPGRPADLTLTVDDIAALPVAVAMAAARVAATVPETVVLRLDLARELDDEDPDADLDPVVPGERPDRVEAAPEVVAAVAAAERPVVLAGPGVLRGGAAAAHVAGLHAVAAAASVGVLNTWGAKGLFHWRSRHHLATVGLQARDFELAGLADADLVIATGIDPAEAPPEAWQIAPWVEVEPAALANLSERWSRPPAPIEPVPLRRVLSEAVARWWESDAVPLAPARAVADMAALVGPRGLVAADPGHAGLWVARTFATTRLGSVAVPARAGTEGWAVACALVALLRDPTRPVLAVVDRIDAGSVTARLVEEVLGMHLPLVVAVWDPDSPPTSPAQHRAVLAQALSERQPQVCRFGVDMSHTDDLVDTAGPVAAWRG